MYNCETLLQVTEEVRKKMRCKREQGKRTNLEQGKEETKGGR